MSDLLESKQSEQPVTPPRAITCCVAYCFECPFQVETNWIENSDELGWSWRCAVVDAEVQGPLLDSSEGQGALARAGVADRPDWCPLRTKVFIITEVPKNEQGT